MQITPYINKALQYALGKEFVTGLIKKLSTVETEAGKDYISFKWSTQLLSLGQLNLTGTLLLDEDRATKAIQFELDQSDQTCVIPGFDKLKTQLTAFELEIDRDKRPGGKLFLNTEIAGKALQLAGSLEQEEEHSQWTLDFSQNTAIRDLLSNSLVPVETLDTIGEKLNIDLTEKLSGKLVLVPEKELAFHSTLPLKPLRLSTGLNITKTRFITRVSLNKEKPGMGLLLSGDLNRENKVLAQTSIKILADKKRLSFEVNLKPKKGKEPGKLNQSLTLEELLAICGLKDIARVPDMQLQLTRFYFDTDEKFELSGGTSLDIPHLAKAEFPVVTVKANAQEKTFSLDGNATIALDENLLTRKVTSESSLKVQKERDTPLSFSLSGSFSINKLGFEYKTDLNKEQKSFSASTKNISLHEAVLTFSEAELPVGIPNPSLDKLTFDYTKGKSLKITGQTSNREDLTIAGSDINISEIDFTFKKLAEAALPDITLATKFNLNLLDTIKIDQGTFDFKLTQKDEKALWELKNGMTMDFFGHRLGLQSSYTYTDSSHSIDFEVSDFPKIEFIEGIGFQTQKVRMGLVKEKDKELSLALTTTASFTSPLLNIENGTISLDRNQDHIALKFESDLNLELPIASIPELPRCSLSSPELHITCKTAESQWVSGGSAKVKFSNVPEVVSQIFPADTLTASFAFGSDEANMMIRFTEKNGKPWELYTIPLPPQQQSQGHSEIDLGNLYLGTNDFKIDFRESELSAKVYLGLPDKLNDVFKKEDGSRMELFKTSKTADAKEAISFKLSMKGDDLSIQMLDSPLKDFKMTDGQLTVDMKVSDDLDFGAFSIVAPKFKFDSGNLAAEGGIEIKRELGIPTTLVKWFLRKIGADAIADQLTPRIPIKGLDFAPMVDGNRTFNSTALLDLFIQNKHSLDIPDWLRTAVSTLDHAVGKLPDALLDYGDFELPDSFSFAIEFSAPSNLKFDISFKPLSDKKKTKPLKVLIPQFPQLMGVELYSIGFGELWSGTLFHVDIDCGFDSFDIPRIMASIAVDETWPDSGNYLPSPKDLHQRFRIKNLTTLIVYQTEIPIPIPLFYDEISASSMAFEGMGSGAYLSFKKPQLGMAQLTALSNLTIELVKFFKNPSTYKIQWNRMSEGDLTKLVVGPNYWQYPKYIAKEVTVEGDGYKGLRLGHERFEIGAIKILTALMSAIQNGSINELIQTKELNERHGHKVIKVLETIDVDLKYALTTPPEFTSGEDSVRAKWKETGLFANAKTNEFLSMLPPKRKEVKTTEDGKDLTIPVDDNTEGLVTFFDGKAKLGDHFNSQTSLGVIISNAGAGLGGQFDLNIGENVVNALLKGHITITKEGLELAGASYFRMLDTEFFSGSLSLKKGEIHLKAEAGVNPNPIFYVNMNLDGHLNNQEFYLKGDGELNLFGFRSSGDVLYHFSSSQRTFRLSQSQSLFNNLIDMKSSLAYSGGQGVEALAGDLHFGIANLINIDAAGSVTGSSAQFQMSGSVGIEMLGVKTEAKGLLNFRKDQFDYNGYISILNGVIRGNVAGHINNTDFLLGGEGVDFKVQDISFAKTALTIRKAEHDNSLLLGLTGELLGSAFRLSSSLSHTGLELTGSVDPIRWLSFVKPGGGEVYMITIHDGEQGPVIFETSLDHSGVKSAYFKGHVSLLGLSETGVTIYVRDGYWETDITHHFNLGNFLSSQFALNLKMKEGYWVTGDGRLSTQLSIAVPAVKFSFNVWLPFVGTKRVTTTLIPAIHLGTLRIQHDLKFRIYLNEEIAELSANLRKAIADLQKEEADANARLHKSEQALLAQKNAGGYNGHKEAVTNEYNQYKIDSDLGRQLRDLDTYRAEIMTTMRQILDECYDNDLSRHEKFINDSLDKLVRVLEKIGYNQFESSCLYQQFRSDLFTEMNQILKDRSLKVLIQHTDYNMARPGGSSEKVEGEMRKEHAGDEFDLQVAFDHTRIKQGSYTLTNHSQNPTYKNYKQAIFTKQEVLGPPPASQNMGIPVYVPEELHEIDVNLNISYDKGFKIAHKSTKNVLSFRGDHKDIEKLQWRPEGPDRYKMFVQITGDDLPAGNFKIKSDYQHFVVRPGGDNDIYQAEIRTKGTGDRLHISGYDTGTYKIRQGGYYMVVPGNHSNVRRADFRKQSSPNEGLAIKYDAGQGGHYISYANYFLYANTDNGQLQFRSDGHKTAFKLFREVESDALFRALEYIPKRTFAHFEWLWNGMDANKNEGHKSYGLFKHHAIDEYKKAYGDMGRVHYLEDKVMQDKHEVLKITEKIRELTGQLEKIKEQQSSSDIHFWMEFSTEFSYAGISFKLGQIRINFKVSEYTNFNKCLEQIPGIVAENLKENALRIFSGKPLPDHTRNYARSVRSFSSGPQPDFSKLNKEYQIEEKGTNEIDHSLDEFL